MRCFIAVELSEQAKDNIEEAKAKLPKTLKLVERENLHITIKFLGEISEEKAKQVEKQLEKLARKKFALRLKGAGVFPSRKLVRVAWIGAESIELKQLADAVNNQLTQLGFEKDKFTSHATIARAREKLDATATAQLNSFLDEYKNTEFGESTVESIVLKKSTLTPKGPIYEDVNRVSFTN
ncbi:RNA 2',3'-cyclic phosphodiesterase [Candidatus Micrarchaeota archaeon]|nr:RNA 2',3'-cyclic phosphodiesterase [Candidatus Micrarchaeota archaeon]